MVYITICFQNSTNVEIFFLPGSSFLTWLLPDGLRGLSELLLSEQECNMSMVKCECWYTMPHRIECFWKHESLQWLKLVHLLSDSMFNRCKHTISRPNRFLITMVEMSFYRKKQFEPLLTFYVFIYWLFTLKCSFSDLLYHLPAIQLIGPTAFLRAFLSG